MKYNLNTKIKSALRKLWSSHPEKKKALNRAKVPYKGEGRRRYSIRCERCKSELKLGEKIYPINKDGKRSKRAVSGYTVHHLEMLPTVNKLSDWGKYIEKLFCNSDGFLVLCLKCHKDIHKEMKNV